MKGSQLSVVLAVAVIALIVAIVFVYFANKGAPPMSARIPVKLKLYGTSNDVRDPCRREHQSTLGTTSAGIEDRSDGLNLHTTEQHAIGEEIPFTDAEAGAPETTEQIKLVNADVLYDTFKNAVMQSNMTLVAECRQRILYADEEAVPRLRALLGCGITMVEVEAVRMLAQIGNADALVAALGKLLTVSSDDPLITAYIAAFADCQNSAVAELLSDRLCKTDDPTIRYRMARILVSLRGSDVTPVLANQLASPRKDDKHTVDCAEVLVSRNDASDVPALTTLLDANGPEYLQNVYATELANIGNDAACKSLIYGACSSGAAAIPCLQALAQVGSLYGQETLIQAVNDLSLPSDVRSSAVRALSEQSSSHVETILMNLQRAETDPAVQWELSGAVDKAKKRASAFESTVVNEDKSVETWF
jgi:HEAT repeat protein